MKFLAEYWDRILFLSPAAILVIASIVLKAGYDVNGCFTVSFVFWLIIILFVAGVMG